MTRPPASTSTPLQPACAVELGMACGHSAEGHELHLMRRRLAAATPSKWADALVAGVSADGRIELVSVETSVRVVAWHHESLVSRLTVGEPVAIHTTYNVLAIGSEWRSVTLLG